jgi:ribose-phosphate pyrophosphokinase
VIGEVQGKTCIVNDDMIDTGGSVINGARALKEAGAAEIYVCATHGLFSGEAYQRIESSDDLTKVVVCDTVPVPKRRQRGKIEVVSVAPLLARAMSSVFNDESVSEIFDPDFQL